MSTRARSYWARVLARAAEDAWHSVVGHTLRSILILAAINALVVGLRYWLSNWAETVQEVTTVAYGVVATLAVLGVVFLWFVLRTPAVLEAEASAMAEALKVELAGTLAAQEAKLSRLQERKGKREALAAFLAEATSLLHRCAELQSEEEYPEFEVAVNDWYQRIHDYLTLELDRSYSEALSTPPPGLHFQKHLKVKTAEQVWHRLTDFRVRITEFLSSLRD